MINSLGRHAMRDLHGCNETYLADIKRLRRKLLATAILEGATIVSASCGKNRDGSCFADVIIAESHVVIHTIPKNGQAFLEAFTCGDSINPETIVETLVKIIPHRFVSRPEMILRGVFGDGDIHFPHKITEAALVAA